jgi:hypothetical protein
MAGTDGINPPGEDRVPPGPGRDLILALHELYRGAGRPPLRRIAGQVKKGGYHGTVSHETIGVMLHGSRSFPRWDKFDPVVRVLAAWPGHGLDPDTEARRFKKLWDAAQDHANGEGATGISQQGPGMASDANQGPHNTDLIPSDPVASSPELAGAEMPGQYFGEPTPAEPGRPVETPRSVAPERLQGHPGTEASDLYAPVLHPAAAFRPPAGTAARSRPASAESATVLVTKPATGKTPAPSAPDRLARLIGNLRSDSPEGRPNAAEAAQILDGVIGQLRHEADRGTPAEAPAVSRRVADSHAHTSRRLLWSPRRAAVLVAAGCALVAALSAVLTNGFGLAGGTAVSGVAPVSAFRVAAVADTAPDVFGVEGNGTLQHQYYWGGQWRGWDGLRPPAGNARIAGVPSLAQDGTGREEAFARTASGTLLRWWQDSPGRGPWMGPKQVGSTPITSDPSVVELPDGQLEAFARLPDGSLGTSRQAGTGPTAAWSGWQSLGGSLGGTPVAALDAADAPEVFAITPQGNLAFTSMGDGTWSRWSMLPGQSRDRFTGVPAVAANSGGGIEVFARTAAGTLDHWWHAQTGSAGWTGPVQLGSGLHSDPAAALDPSGRLQVFAVLADGSVAMARQATAGNPTAWPPWTRTGLTASSFLAVLVTDSQTYVFARETNGTIAGIAGTPTTGWSPIQLDGSF